MLNFDGLLKIWYGSPTYDFVGRIRGILGPYFHDGTVSLHGCTLDREVETDRSNLALILLYDQAPRLIFSGTRRMFAYDQLAVRHADQLWESWPDWDLTPCQQVHACLPYLHAEDYALQGRALRGFESAAAAEPALTVRIARARHYRRVIRRFGRFPHRNRLLGRPSTREEERFLATGDADK